MDSPLLPPFFGILTPDLIPYAILAINFIIFQLLRSYLSRLFTYYLIRAPAMSYKPNHKWQQQQSEELSGKCRFFRLLLSELISTSELCADCAELNIVYVKHGSFMYGLSLFILTYFWLDTFGDAHTTPGYVFEDYFFDKGNELLKRGDTYARFLGQSLAIPLAWRFASIYWNYELLSEHSEMVVEKCRSSLNTTTMNGFLIELSCCLLCRLFELYGNKLLCDNNFGKRFINMIFSFLSTALVVAALELSGGYFNPVLAASLEYGCEGINFYQHVIIFWLGPLIGHVLAKKTFKKFVGEKQINKRKSIAIQKSGSKSNIAQQSNSIPVRPATRSSRKKRD